MTSPRVDAGPFEPDGVVWQPVSPRLASARLATTAIVLGLPFVGGVVAAILSGETWVWVFPAVVAVLAAWCVVLIPRQVRAIGYAERADDLLIRKGIVFRTMVVVPYGRMQYVDVQAGPLARAFGIAQVQLHTASPGTDAAIDGLTPDEASRVRGARGARSPRRTRSRDGG
jgi:membrane protein YdbS with pleckstrin-like domain